MSRPRHLLVPALLGLLAGLAPTDAAAQFDLVQLYQDKVKGFEAVYYLEEDDSWARDRRVFEMFGTLNLLDRDEDTDLGEAMFHWNAGLLVNVKPKRGQVQFTFFSMGNQLRFLVNDVTEMLHGGRITASDLLEVSLGGYWFLENTRASSDQGSASMFLEVNFPFIGARSSYVLGKKLQARASTERDPILRFDLRYNYDKLSFVDDLEAKVVRYNLGDADNVVGALRITRIGAPTLRFLSAEVGYSFSEKRLAMVAGGLDFLYQASQDFNATRRGHFGTSVGLQLFGTYASPLGYRRFRPRVSVEGSPDPVAGMRAQATFQIPAKWLWTAIGAMGAAYLAAEEEKKGNYAEAEKWKRVGGQMIESTVRQPKDELFVRLVASYSLNDPTLLEMFPGYENQHRLFVSLGIMY